MLDKRPKPDGIELEFQARGFGLCSSSSREPEINLSRGVA